MFYLRNSYNWQTLNYCHCCANWLIWWERERGKKTKQQWIDAINFIASANLTRIFFFNQSLFTKNLYACAWSFAQTPFAAAGPIAIFCVDGTRGGAHNGNFGNSTFKCTCRWHINGHRQIDQRHRAQYKCHLTNAYCATDPLILWWHHQIFDGNFLLLWHSSRFLQLFIYVSRKLSELTYLHDKLNYCFALLATHHETEHTQLAHHPVEMVAERKNKNFTQRTKTQMACTRLGRSTA